MDTPAKPTHLMTADEYYRSQVGTTVPDSLGRNSTFGSYPHHERLARQEHRLAIRRALKAGEHVPSRVLRDQPGVVGEVRDEARVLQALRRMRPGTRIFFDRDLGGRGPVEFRKLDADERQVLVREGGKNRRLSVGWIRLTAKHGRRR